jgi:fructose PTS system EIIBC or EIIC component
LPPDVLVPNAPALLVLAIVLMTGLAFGAVAARLRLPSITGQILAGVLLGSVGLRVFDQHSVNALAPLTDFALGLMGVTIGAHLSVRRLRNAGLRLGWLVLLESLVIPGLVLLGLLLFRVRWSEGLMFGAIAVSTAPATVVAIVRETRSKGVFTKTLIAAVALNNMSCIVLFELARVAAHIDLGKEERTPLDLILTPLSHLTLALLLGCTSAIAIQQLMRWVRRTELLATAGLVAIVFTWGMASALHISPLLACLFIGLAQTNLTRERGEIIDRLFSNFEPAILTIFFTLAGMGLALDHAEQVGTIALTFFGCRVAGKLIASWGAMRFARAPGKIRRNLGLALLPQAGVAVGLVLILEQDAVLSTSSAESVHLFTTVVLAVVVINEIIGPILTRIGLARSGETDRDRTRLIDFIQEENIVTDFEASSKQDAIEKLTGVLVGSHHLDPKLRQPLLESILEREKEFSTCLGGGLAVPHGTLPEGDSMLGVLGISRKGLDFQTPDGEPIKYMVLLVTPQSQRDRHLQVLAAIAHSIGHDPALGKALIDARTPAHAYDVLHNEASEDFNYFLEDPD